MENYLSNLPCRTGCGKQVKYEHIGFPDGFIYFLPRNNDLTIHDCPNLPKIDDGCTGMTWSKEEQDLEDYLQTIRTLPTKEFKEYTSGPKAEEMNEKINSCPNQFNREYLEIESTYLNDHWDNRDGDIPPEKMASESSFYERDLLNSQMRCILFPSPFFFTPNLTKIPDLLWLSKCYENLGKYECAIIARMIQDKITHDQGNEILKLEKLKKDFSQQNEIDRKSVV